MKTVNFKWCIIGSDYIVVHTSDTDISYSPASHILIVNGTITIDGIKAAITGNEVITHFHFNRVYVKDLDYVPEKLDIKYTLFRKKPYVKYWVQDSKRQKFEKTFINYKIEIE